MHSEVQAYRQVISKVSSHFLRLHYFLFPNHYFMKSLNSSYTHYINLDSVFHECNQALGYAV